MLQCAPYIKNICKSLNDISSEDPVPGDLNDDEGAREKKNTLVQIKDVKSAEVKLLKDETNLISVVDDSSVSSKQDLYKALRKVRPDSPDVIRAAKRVEQARLKITSNPDQILESIEENTVESGEKSLGAINRING